MAVVSATRLRALVEAWRRESVSARTGGYPPGVSGMAERHADELADAIRGAEMRMLRLNSQHYVRLRDITEVDISGKEGDFMLRVRMGDDRDPLVVRRGIKTHPEADAAVAEIVQMIEEAGDNGG